jgi:hypothetical protein
MDRFLNQRNIERYRKLIEARNAAERLQIMKLLAEEKAKFKLELRNDHLKRASSKSYKSIVKNGVPPKLKQELSGRRSVAE